MPRINQSIETSILNENGEFISKRANKTLSWGAEPAYVKLYLQDILYLSDMTQHHEKILYALLKRSAYAGSQNGMQVSLSAGTKRLICKELGIKNIHSIDNVLTDLVRGKVLYRIETGVYNLNPYLFGKGDWQDIARLRLEINYDELKGRTFKTACEYKEENCE